MSAPLIALFAGYLLGAIPFGYIIVRLLHGADVRAVGSGSTGATNVTRKAGIKAGALTYLLDVAKGAAAVLLMGQVTDSWWWAGAAATAAIVGHMFPVFLGFKGGKGVATGVGAYIVLVPFAVVCTLVVWALVFKASRMVSLSSIVATALVPLVWMPLSYALLGRPEHLTAATASVGVGCALIIWAHRANIARLLAGTENRFERGMADAESDGRLGGAESR
jgi:acyl phosphate:glycerol-3-phosphate acyltransferase